MVNPKSQSNELKKGLYLVPTPIGNLSDITIRAVEILKRSDFILCEDTRVSKNLLDRYEVKSKLISNHKFNESKNLLKITDFLKSGKIVSLISDAGTPGISDPGALLIKECKKEKINVIPLPGPSAVTTALSVSGFSDKYFFYGFYPEKNKFSKEILKHLLELNSSLVFFISPKKINKIIPFIKKNFIDREILICREMTKLYEQYINCKVSELHLFEKEPKGELTIVLSEKKEDKKSAHLLSESDKKIINKTINKLSIKDIVSMINKNTKVSKKEIYNYCLKLRNEK